MPQESTARMLINNQLKHAGWILPPVTIGCTVETEGGFRSSFIKRAFKGKRPDYHLYASGDVDIPIGFIEAKAEGKSLVDALEQGREYAKIVNGACQQDVCQIVIASNGRITRGCNHRGHELLVNNVELDSIPSPTLAKELAEKPEVHTGRAADTTKCIVDLFELASKQLRKAGVGAGMPSLLEFCKILFIKILSERENQVKARKQWQALVELEGDGLVREFRSAMKHWRELYASQFFQPLLSDSQVIARIVSKMNEINFDASNIDIKGTAYEWFLTKYAAGPESGFGQNFTPRHITRAMAVMLEVDSGDRIYDPFAGTGGMLLSCYEEIAKVIGRETRENRLRWNQLRRKTLFGTEIDVNIAPLAQMNMIIVGDGHTNIKSADSLKIHEPDKYSVVITNIPFNMEKPSGVEQEHFSQILEKSTVDSNEACIVHCIDSITCGGKYAIIVPETILYGSRYKHLRRWIEDCSRIRGVIRLPRIVFSPYTVAKTAIILGDSVHKCCTEEFPIVEVSNDGFSEDEWRQPQPGSDIPRIVESFLDDRQFEIGTIVKSCSDKWTEEHKLKIKQNVNGLKLRDILQVREEKEYLDPDEEYAEPSLDSLNHEVSVRRKRLGSNFKEKKKVIAKKGDLIIGCLHTNNRKGLFGFADQEYVLASQLAGRVKTEIVSKRYLAIALEAILPRLKKEDLVKRETFKKEELLDLDVPLPTSDSKKLEREWESAKNDLANARNRVNNAKQSYVDSVAACFESD